MRLYTQKPSSNKIIFLGRFRQGREADLRLAGREVGLEPRVNFPDMLLSVLGLEVARMSFQRKWWGGAHASLIAISAK
jgi:hypothetical protein